MIWFRIKQFKSSRRSRGSHSKWTRFLRGPRSQLPQIPWLQNPMRGRCAWQRYWMVFLSCRYLFWEPVSSLMGSNVRAQPTFLNILILTPSSNKSLSMNLMGCSYLTSNTWRTSGMWAFAPKMASLKCPQKSLWVRKRMKTTLQTKTAIKSKVTTGPPTKESGSHMNTRKGMSVRDWCLICSQISSSSYRIWNQNMSPISQQRLSK
jgi:hypothetical protein